MKSVYSHQDAAAEAAMHADRLQGDLASLRYMLNQYAGPNNGLEDLQYESARIMGQLEAISHRLGALGASSDQGKYNLSDPEHAALDAALDLRARMTKRLAYLQDDEREAVATRH